MTTHGDPEAGKAIHAYYQNHIKNLQNADTFDLEVFREKFQAFIESSGCTVLAIVQTPRGSQCSFSNKGMPTSTALGLLTFASMDFSAGMAAQRSIEAIRYHDAMTQRIRRAASREGSTEDSDSC